MSDPTSVINLGRIIDLFGSMIIVEAAAVLAVLIWLAVLARRAHRRETSELVSRVGPQISATGPRVHARFDAQAAARTRARAAAAPAELAARERLINVDQAEPSDARGEDLKLRMQDH